MKKVTIDLTADCLQLDGGKTNQTLGQILGSTFCQDGETSNPRKLFAWGSALWNTGKLENIDESDFKMILAYVEQPRNIVVLAKGPILQVLDKCAEEFKTDVVKTE